MQTYTVTFGRAGGCPIGVAEDMARFDAGKIVAKVADTDCQSDHYRSVTIQGRFAPTMARWASFMLGARITNL